MKLKMAVAGVSLAGGVGAALMGLNPVVANGEPCGPPGVQCGGPGAPGVPPPHGPAGPPAGRAPGDQPRDLRGPDPGGPPGEWRGPGGPPGEWRGPGGPPGDWHGPGDWGPRPPDAFRGWRNAPWGDGPAPWGWGPPPPAAWNGPLPNPWGPPPAPINYWGYNEQPIWSPDSNQWGFWFFGIWIPLPTL